MIYAGCPSFFNLGVEDDHLPTFCLLLEIPAPNVLRLKGTIACSSGFTVMRAAWRIGPRLRRHPVLVDEDAVLDVDVYLSISTSISLSISHHYAILAVVGNAHRTAGQVIRQKFGMISCHAVGCCGNPVSPSACLQFGRAVARRRLTR